LSRSINSCAHFSKLSLSKLTNFNTSKPIDLLRPRNPVFTFLIFYFSSYCTTFSLARSIAIPSLKPIVSSHCHSSSEAFSSFSAAAIARSNFSISQFESSREILRAMPLEYYTFDDSSDRNFIYRDLAEVTRFN